MTLDQAANVASYLSRAISSLTSNPQSLLADLDIGGAEDNRQQWAVNRDVPSPIESCVHDMIVKQVQIRPHDPAVCAWDGDLTYRELDDASRRLGYHLITLGVGPDKMVPICFEHSKWAIVAMLAVLQAGGAFVPLNPSQAMSGRERVLSQTDSRVVLTSTYNSHLSFGDSRNAISVNDDLIKSLPAPPSTGLKKYSPASLCYVLFTSGSTGIPKGVMLEHQSVSSGCSYHGAEIGVSHTTRMVQFAAYTFDASIFEILTTLIHGGCVCIPSDEDRVSNLAARIKEYDINTGVLTPSVIRTLDPTTLRRFEVLLMGGESIPESDYKHIIQHANIMDAYGPTEAMVMCTLGHGRRIDRPASHIGKAVGSACWVVNPNDHNILAPLGAVGELLVEGPILARGYLNDPEKTASAFVKDPPWLVSGNPHGQGRRGRLYKTGDLVRFNPDGSLSFIGRKDTQIKMHGQRVELGEIEHHVRECIPEAHSAKHLAAEVCIPPDENVNGKIVVFMTTNNTGTTIAKETHPVATDKLAAEIPAHMLPTMYLSLPEMPLTTSGKIDRRSLREIGGPFLAQRLAELRSATAAVKRQPSTNLEKQLQKIWAHILKIETQSIGLDDDFFQLGGDSILAMQLVSEARRNNLSLPMANIFRAPLLSTMATGVSYGPSNDSSTRPEPFSLVSGQIVSEIQTRDNNTESSNVEDIIPTTDFQEHNLRMCTDTPQTSLNYFTIRLGTSVDVDQWIAACHRMLETHSILRSIFTPLHGVHWQVVLRQSEPSISIVDIRGDVSSAIQKAFEDDTRKPLVKGTSFTKFTLFRHATGFHMMIRLSHAQYDGVSLPIMLRTFFDAYNKRPLVAETPFSTFLAHAKASRPAALSYWKQLLQGAQISPIRPRLHSVNQPTSPLVPVEAECSMALPTLPSGITVAALVSGAWGRVLSQLVGRTDVVYGQVVSGRNASLPGLQEVVGPCVNIIPVRVRLDDMNSPRELLAMMQDHFMTLRQGETMGLDDIIRECTDWEPGTELDSVVEHFGGVTLPQVRVQEEDVQAQYLKHPMSTTTHLGVFSTADHEKLILKITGNSALLRNEEAESIVNLLRKTITVLTGKT